MMKREMVDKQGESMVASYRYLGVSNPGLQYCIQTSFQYIRRIPALYILRPKKNLRQLESCQPSFQYEWSVDGWMSCHITTPMVDQYKPRQHQTFAKEKILRFDRNNLIMSCRDKKKSRLKKRNSILSFYMRAANLRCLITVNEYFPNKYSAKLFKH